MKFPRLPEVGSPEWYLLLKTAHLVRDKLLPTCHESGMEQATIRNIESMFVIMIDMQAES